MEPPARLLLLRHGQTDWNRAKRWQGHTDIPLNATGLAQADRLALRLRDESIDAVHASDLSRAAQTARRVAAPHGLEPCLSAAWREIGLGELEGAAAGPTTHRGEAVSETVRRGPLAPGAEDFVTLQARLVAGFEALCTRHAGQTVALVGHGGALRTLIAYLLKLDPRWIDRLSLRGNTSVSEIDFRNGRPQLTLLNCTRHLG